MQEEEWSILASVERRDDSLVRQETLQRTPPTPAPSEDRYFTNWSSLESPHVRMSPQSVPMRETGLDINQPINQTIQLGSELAQIGAMGNALHDDINVSSPRICQQLDELGVRMMDMGTNTMDVEVRPHRDGARVVTSDVNIQTPLPIYRCYDTHRWGGSSSTTPDKFMYIRIWTQFIKAFSDRNF